MIEEPGHLSILSCGPRRRCRAPRSGGGHEIESILRGATVRPWRGRGRTPRVELDDVAGAGPEPVEDRGHAVQRMAVPGRRIAAEQYLAPFIERRLSAGENELLAAQSVTERLQQRFEPRDVDPRSLGPPSGRTAHGVRIHRNQWVLPCNSLSRAVHRMLAEGATRRAAYVGGSGSVTLVFAYTLGASDGAASSLTVPAGSLALNGAQIAGRIVGMEADLAHEAVTRTDTAPSSASARFSNMPQGHDGSSAFTFGLAFSHEPDALSYVTVRDSLFDVSGAAITGARRAAPPGNREWLVTVQPENGSSITITLPVRACGEEHAVCFGEQPLSEPVTATVGEEFVVVFDEGPYEPDAIRTAGGTRLQGGTRLTVQAPAAFFVAGAEVMEAQGAVLAFEITLSRSRPFLLTGVSYRTQDITARAGEDYRSKSGRVVFLPGETTGVVEVEVFEDASDEGTETMKLVLSAPFENVLLGDAEAIGTITNTDPMPGQWAIRFGRTVGSQVVDALGARLDAGTGTHVAVGGIDLTSAGAPQEPQEKHRLAMPQWTERILLDALTRTMTTDELVKGSSFRIGTGERGPGTARLTAWGHFVTVGFDAEVDGVLLDGDVTTGLLGADAEFKGLLAGVMATRSDGEGSYLLDPDLGDDKGTVESDLTGAYPYARMALNDRVSTWGVAGFGSGRLTLKTERAGTLETDIDMTMGALGLRGRVLDGSGPSRIGLDLEADAMWVRTATDRTTGLAASEGDVSRMRVIVQAERGFALEGGARLVPSGEIGLRVDDGDTETGAGLELGAGLSYRSGPIVFDGKVRGLVVHEASRYEEWGASGAIRVNPSASGLGPAPRRRRVRTGGVRSRPDAGGGRGSR